MSLKPFEGKSAIGCAVIITKAGDGLSDALKVDPVELHLGDRVFYVLEGEVDQVGFKRLNAASNELMRVHRIVTQRITAVDGSDVLAYLEDAESHVRRALAEISDDQRTLDDAAAEKAEAEAREKEAAEPGSVTAVVDEVKKARAAKKAAKSTPTPAPEPAGVV